MAMVRKAAIHADQNFLDFRGIRNTARSLFTIAPFTADQDNVNLKEGSLVKISSTLPINISGILSKGTEGREVSLLNIGANTITFLNESALSSAGNRVTTGTGSSVDLPANAIISLFYDSDISRWRVRTAPSSGGGGGAGGLIDATFYVNPDPTIGFDTVGLGQEGTPFRTLAFADSQIPGHANSYSTWANQRWTIWAQAGRYTEPGPITFTQKRRAMRLQGSGAIIENEVRFNSDIADYPDGALFNPLLMPEPWLTLSGSKPLSTWEIDGDNAGGIEGGHTANNIILLSVTRWRALAGFPTSVAPVFAFYNRVQNFGGLEYINLSGAALALTCEVNESSFINGHIGADGVSGAVFSFKAQDSQLRSTIGPNMTILRIDNCRVSAVDRLTDLSGGAATGTIVSSVVTSQTHIQNCCFNGTVYNFGQPGAGGILIMDEVSAKRLLAQSGVTFTNCVIRVHDILSGTTAARPTTLVERGTRYYDTTLSVPIWREPAAGTGWVDGIGTAV